MIEHLPSMNLTTHNYVFALPRVKKPTKKKFRKNNSFYSFLFLRLYSHNSVFALPRSSSFRHSTLLYLVASWRGVFPSDICWSTPAEFWMMKSTMWRLTSSCCSTARWRAVLPCWVKRKWDAECDQFVANAHFSNVEGLQKRGLNKPLKISLETQVWLILYHLILYLQHYNWYHKKAFSIVFTVISHLLWLCNYGM